MSAVSVSLIPTVPQTDCEFRTTSSTACVVAHLALSLGCAENSSPCHQTESSDDVRKHIDEAILALKFKRNTLAHISKLTPELLAEVFLICVESAVELYNPLYRLTNWIHLTHVSRHWRNIALNYPNLWAHPIFYSIPWCEEMLRRSKTAPLFIDVDTLSNTLAARWRMEAIQLVVKQMHRSKKVMIVATVPTMETVFAKLVPTSAPILKSLYLAALHQPTDAPYTIPENFLSDDTSSLRRLSLLGCDVKWTSPFLSGLTHLKIHGISVAARSTTAQLLAVLEKMPRLEVLELINCLSQKDSAACTPLPDRVVNLPHLTHLRFNGIVPICGSLLDHMSFPTNIKISLFCDGTEHTGIDFSSILSIFSRMQTQESLLGVTFVINPQSVLFSGYKTAVAPMRLSLPDDFTKRTTPTIDLSFHWVRSDASDAQQVMVSLCKAMPLQQIKIALIVANCEPLDTTAWGSMLGRVPSLTQLGVNGPSGYTILSTLVLKCPDAPNGPHGPSLYFPNLTCLTLELVDFNEGIDGRSGKWKNLMNAMIERCTTCECCGETPNVIQKAKLIDCLGIDSQKVNNLRQVVADVEWNGQEHGLSSDDNDV